MAGVMTTQPTGSSTRADSTEEGEEEEDEREEEQVLLAVPVGAVEVVDDEAGGKAPLWDSSGRKLPSLMAAMTSSRARRGPDMGALAYASMALSPGAAWYPSIRRTSRSRPNLAHHDKHVALRLCAPMFSKSAAVYPQESKTDLRAIANSGVRYDVRNQRPSAPSAGRRDWSASA